MTDRSQRMVWVDLEMTGLDEGSCAIVEIATIVTEPDLTVVAEGPCLVIHQPESVLAGMSDFVRDLHEHVLGAERLDDGHLASDVTSSTDPRLGP